MHELFVQKFAILLDEDGALSSLILEAVSKQEIGPGRARNNFRKLLKHFASDLSFEVVNNHHHHRALVRFIKTNLTNISQEFFSEFSSDDHKAGEKMPEPRIQHYAAGESQKKIEEYLQISQDPEFVEQAIPAHLNKPAYYNDASDQIELSESDEESDQNNGDEELEPDDTLHSDLPESLEEMRQFVLRSTAYQILRCRFDMFVRPSLQSKLGDLLTRWSRHDHRHHSFVARYKLSDLVSELRYTHPQGIRLDVGNKSTRWQEFLGYYQNLAEQWAQAPWDWWPLPYYPRPLENGENLLRWQCEFGEEHWAIVPSPFARRLMSIIRDLPKDGASMGGIQSPSALHAQNTDAHGSSENTFSPTVPSKSGGVYPPHQQLQRASPINIPRAGLVDTQASAISTTHLDHWVLLICLLPKITLFIIWISPLGRGTDLQNASIPISITASMLSIFWSMFLVNGRDH